MTRSSWIKKHVSEGNTLRSDLHVGTTVSSDAEIVLPFKVARQSRLYESAPAYVTDQPRFVNAALAVTTALPPRELLAALKAIEVRLTLWAKSLPSLDDADRPSQKQPGPYLHTSSACRSIPQECNSRMLIPC